MELMSCRILRNNKKRKADQSRKNSSTLNNADIQTATLEKMVYIRRDETLRTSVCSEVISYNFLRIFTKHTQEIMIKKCSVEQTTQLFLNLAFHAVSYELITVILILTRIKQPHLIVYLQQTAGKTCSRLDKTQNHNYSLTILYFTDIQTLFSPDVLPAHRSRLNTQPSTVNWEDVSKSLILEKGFHRLIIHQEHFSHIVL